MTDQLTQHQRSILEAVLLGLEIECRTTMRDNDNNEIWTNVTKTYDLLHLISDIPKCLRIKPGQESKVTRLYSKYQFPGARDFFSQRNKGDTHYIDIGPNGIVGGKL